MLLSTVTLVSLDATAFYGDGSNLENTGATLSAAAGTQRLVVTSLTSGTMVDAATDSDLTYNATTDTLNVENIDVDGHTELDQLRVAGVSTFAGDVDISSNGNLTVAGNLIVQGTETRLNTTVLEVEDINIGIASVTPTLSDAALDGAGITIHGNQGDKTLTWSNANSRMEFNTDVNVANLRLDDTQKAFFGDGNDLRIYHSGTASFIEQTGTGTGPLNIRQAIDDADIVIQSDNGSGGTAAYFRADGSNGEAVLYHYGSEKFATKSDGIDVTGHTETDTLRVSGVSTFQDSVNLGDNKRLKFGDDGDFEIYHAGTFSVIKDTSGSLVYRSGTHRIKNQGSTEDLATFNANGSVDLYYDNSLKFQTIGYGVTIYNDLTVGTGVTIYGNAGIVSAISFYGDGSNLTNTGATLSATSGVERLVTTQLTSGTMVDAATDADLTFNATTNLLHTPKIDVAGLSPDGATFGTSGYVPVADGSGGWNWANLQGASAVNTILNGFTVSEEGNVVGTAGSITQLDFRGVNILATAVGQPNGIATITMSETPTFEQINITGITTLGGPVTAGSSEGVLGQYLRHVGTGVTWASFPQLRVTRTDTATANQTTFNFNYNVDFLDVFVNGVKLTSSEYSANNGSQIVLNTPAFAGEIVEFHSYNVASTYGSGGGGGASNLNGLSDVNFPIALADNQLLQFNSSTNVWENVAVTSLPYATEAFVGLSTTGLASESFVGLSTAGLASETFVGLSTAGLASEAFVGLATAGLASEAFVGLATNLAGLLTAHQSLIGKANVTIGDNPPGIGTASGDLWWESDTAKGHIYYDDGSSAQWVEFNPSSGGGGGGGGGSYGDADVDSHLNVSGASSGQILSWNGSDYAWVADQTGGGGGGGISTHDVRTNSLEVYTGVSTFVGYAATFAAQFKNNVFIDAGAYAMFGNSIDKFSIRNTVGKSQLISGQNGGNVEILSQQSGSVIKIGKYSGGANDIALFTVDAGVELFHNTAKKFETLGTGVTVTGTTFSNQLSVSGVSTFAGRVDISGNNKLNIGNLNDYYLQWDENSQSATLQASATGNLYFTNNVNGGIYLNAGTGNQSGVHLYPSGRVELKHAGNKKLETTSTGVTVTGTVAATAFTGDGSGLTNVSVGSTNLVTTWTLGANGSSDYTFTGPGVAAGAQDPTIYLVRGQTYKFENRSGGHPFRIQYEFQNTGGTAYNDGIVNNGAGNHNTDLYWEVRNDAPDLLHYQCTAPWWYVGQDCYSG